MFVRDHLKIEDIPKEDAPDKLQDELNKFQAAQKNVASRIASMQADQKKKKKTFSKKWKKAARGDREKEVLRKEVKKGVPTDRNRIYCTAS